MWVAMELVANNQSSQPVGSIRSTRSGRSGVTDVPLPCAWAKALDASIRNSGESGDRGRKDRAVRHVQTSRANQFGP